MSQDGDLGREVEALRERLSRLSEASLRINQSLEFEAVLREALESARELTGAAYGVIVLVDEKGEPEDFLSAGISAEQDGEFWEMPDRWEFFDFLFRIEEPQRIDDFQSYLQGQGLPEFLPPVPVSPALAVLAVPVLHRDQKVGAIYVSEKEGGFSEADEEIFVMLASQAALVISNARRYRYEQQARADLEALVNTSPMGVLVLDAGTGELKSVNREARRIMGDLGLPIGSMQELISSGTYQRADGQEISQKGLSLEASLTSGETVRDEEMVVEFPNGRKMTAIINATPIRSADGEVKSVVVSAQDMTPLAEMERLRAEFLGMIGHELRSPLAAIKGSAATLLQAKSPVSPAEMVQFFRIIDEQADYMRDLLTDLIDIVQIETGTILISPEPVELARLVDEARTTFLGAGGRDNISIDLFPGLPLVMADRRRIVQVISNLLTNAARYSHDASAIRIEADEQGTHVAVSVADNGRGLSADRLPHLFAKFTRPDGPDQGRDLGLGLSICKGIVEAHGGRIWAESDGPGLGSRFTFTVPVSEGAVPGRSQTPGHTGAAAERRRVLAIDDDPRALKHIRDSLTSAGYDPTLTGDPGEVAALLADTDPHLVLLDLMLPGTDGIELMREILAARDVPVIFLSAYGQDDQIAKAFEMGAADYIVKPFSPTELAARIRAAMRSKRGLPGRQPSAAPSAPGPSAPDRFELGDMVIDHAARMVAVAGQPVDLTPIEYRLLVELAANVGVLLTHEQLLNRVWGADKAADASRMRTVVKNLRQKLGDNARNSRYIATVPHVGYRMPAPEYSTD